MAYLENEFKFNENVKLELENNLNSYFDGHIQKNDFIGIIGEYEQNIVSVAYLVISDMPANPNWLNGKSGTLLNVYTYPKYRNKGIATELIKEIIKEAKKLNIKSIDLSATKAGINIYKKLGFNESEYTSMSIKI
jgi:ribosomal protein S18 acetylase RimI-like enzyme